MANDSINVRFRRVETLDGITGVQGTIYFVTSTNLIYVFNGESFEPYGESTHNKVTALSSSSTHQEYPSAKAVYDVIVENEEITASALTDLDSRIKDLDDNKLNAPGTAGTSGQVLKTDGNGSTLWETINVPDVSQFITNAVNNLTNYYTKSETYTKSEINDLIDVINQFDVAVADELPEASSEVSRTMYLVPAEYKPTVRDEWIAINREGTWTWERIGGTEIDIEGYATIEYVDEIEEVAANALTDLDSRLSSVEGQSFKTINGESILGTGDLTLSTDILTEITYSELVTLRNNSGLTPGMQYRITDFVTTVHSDSGNARSANHPFDIIVTADDEKTLNENARAIQHEIDPDVKVNEFVAKDDYEEEIGMWHFYWSGDAYCCDDLEMALSSEITNIHVGDTFSSGQLTFTVIFTDVDYFGNRNLSAWELKYCLDNDNTRFAWADATNGKGVIYYMKDEWDNECPYDFKNVQYKRFKITSSSISSLVGTYMGMHWVGPGDSECEFNIPSVAELDTEDFVWRYTFTLNGYDSTLNGGENGVYSNKIEKTSGKGEYGRCAVQEYPEQSALYNRLNDIVFDGSRCCSNTFGTDCYSNTFGYGCYSNTFGTACAGNTFGTWCTNNTFGEECGYNTFETRCGSNTFGTSCSSNTFGTYCQYNTFGNYCQYNTFEASCQYNTFGNYCIDNTFEASCNRNTFGTNSTGTAGNYFRYNTLENGVQYCILYNTSTASSSQLVKNYHIKSSVVGTSSSKKLIEATRNNVNDIEVAMNLDGELVQYCCADNDGGGSTSGGATYTAGTNIDITNNVISVTGITVPTKTSDLTNDSGFLTEHQSLSNYSTTTQMNSAISTATNDMATQTWVGGQGYLTSFTETDPIFVASPAHSITSANLSAWNSKYDKPSTGIPKTDLASAVQTSLGLADTALQTHQSIKTVNGNTITGTGNVSVGTVTSVGVSVPTGLSVSGSPVTTSGTVAISLASGYSIPTTTKQSSWDAKYDKPSTGIPKTDLDSTVQSSLNLADTSFQQRGAITSSTDLNSLEPGVYNINNITNSGFPTSDIYFGGLIQLAGDRPSQIFAAGLNNAAPKIYVRRKTSTNWTAWVGLQESISDLETIRSGAALGATAIQNVKTVNGNTLTGTGNVNVGTVTSAGITAGTGITVSGSPITTSGNITVGLPTTMVGSTTVSSISSIPVTHRAVLATISANSTLSFASLPADGFEVHVIIRNSGSSTISVTLPSTGSYICTSESTIYVATGKYAEVNVLTIGSTGYIHGISSI